MVVKWPFADSIVPLLCWNYSMDQAKQTRARWGDILTREYAAKIATLMLAVWLHASNSMLTATTMPSAVNDIGGLNLLHWTFSLYLIGSIVAGACIGLLVIKSDIRTMMIRAALVYAVGCAIVALAPSMPVVLVGRVLQGLGGGGLMGLVYVAQDKYFPNYFVPKIVAGLSLTWMIAAFCGPMIGGAFATWGIWRMAYWAFAGQALLLIIAISFLLPKEQKPKATKNTDQKSERIPIIRLAILASAIGLVSLAGAEYDSVMSPLLVSSGAIALGMFVYRDRTALSSRILPKDITNLNHPIGNGVLTIFLLCLCIMSFLIYGPVILIKLYGLSPFYAGLIIMAETLAWSSSAIIFSSTAEHKEPILIRTGSALVVIGLISLAFALSGQLLWVIIITSMISNLGFGMMWGFIIKRIIGHASANEKTRTSSLLPMTLQSGFAFGAALSGVIANSFGMSETMSDDGIRQVAFWLFAGFVPIALMGNIFAWRFVR
jgi:MFS family permease